MAEFRRVGFANAQIEDIVATAGVARGTFYFHFPTKEHVLIEHQRRGQEHVIERLATLRRRTIGVKAFLQQLVDAVVAEHAAVGEPGLMRDLFSLYLRQPTSLAGEQHPLLEAIAQFFTEAQGRGEVRSDLTPAELTTIFFLTLFGILIGNLDSGGPELRTSLRRVIDVFVRGVAP